MYVGTLKYKEENKSKIEMSKEKLVATPIISFDFHFK